MACCRPTTVRTKAYICKVSRRQGCRRANWSLTGKDDRKRWTDASDQPSCGKTMNGKNQESAHFSCKPQWKNDGSAALNVAVRHSSSNCWTKSNVHIQVAFERRTNELKSQPKSISSMPCSSVFFDRQSSGQPKQVPVLRKKFHKIGRGRRRKTNWKVETNQINFKLPTNNAKNEQTMLFKVQWSM